MLNCLFHSFMVQHMDKEYILVLLLQSHSAILTTELVTIILCSNISHFVSYQQNVPPKKKEKSHEGSLAGKTNLRCLALCEGLKYFVMCLHNDYVEGTMYM